MTNERVCWAPVCRPLLALFLVIISKQSNWIIGKAGPGPEEEARTDPETLTPGLGGV